MKRTVIVILWIVLYHELFAQSDKVVIYNPEKSTIYFYRFPTFAGAYMNIKIYSDEIPIGNLKNGSFFKYEAFPGDYLFSCNLSEKSMVKLKTEPGRTYYIKCHINPGFWTETPVLELTDSISGKAAIEGGRLNNQQSVPISLIRPRSRIGLCLGAGAGFESILIGYTSTHEKITLSTGGGIAFGAQFGYESNHFDLSFECFYQNSLLSQKISNGNGSFSRIGIIITPAFVIPIRKAFNRSGEYSRLRLGAGFGFYNEGTMTVNLSISGYGNYHYLLKYEPAIGIHASLNFESYISDKFSMSLGLKYYNINYHFRSVGSNYFSTDPKFNKPDGSGLDFLMGVCYHI